MEHLLENDLSIYLQSQLIRQAVLYVELTFLQLSFTAPSVYLEAHCFHEVPRCHFHFKCCCIAGCIPDAELPTFLKIATVILVKT